MQSDITIILPVYNGANYITKAIDSVLSQSYHGWKFLILDNCSTDNTAEICEPYLADSRITYICNETNIGLHGNFYKALSLVDTKYYAYLCHDDLYVRPDAFDEARNILEADDSLAMVNAPVRWLDQNDQIISSYGVSNVGFQGKVLARDITKASILKCRNLFGIAALARTSLGQTLHPDKRLFQASDINYLAGVGGDRYVYVLKNPAYAIRFHQTNNTLHQFDTLIDEMNLIAENHGIQLNTREKFLQKLNSLKIRIGKRLFYLMLNRQVKTAKT